MTSRHIRQISIGLIWNNGSLLVEHGFDSVKGEHFFRPPGGAIEFGERAIDALRREFIEELEAELLDAKLITVLENLFQYEAQPGHELVFVFEAKFKDSRLYERAEFAIQELNVHTSASWKSLSELAGSERPLYPDGLKALLSELANTPRGG
jgi:ADP-ribose pyrophosphatase YjhB (NUDIX family)